jgi:rapamycin-insensitive companion of mTOR
MDVCEMSVHFLEEACESMEILQLVVEMQPTVDHLGEIGHPLLLKYVYKQHINKGRRADVNCIRFMSTAMGFRYLFDAGYIDREMDMWLHVCCCSIPCERD